MKKIIAILVFCQTLYMNAQTNYDRGYQRGWKEGYCQNHDGVSCLPPNPPMTPMSRINENDNSYKDGYNRGFTDGLAAYRGGNSRSNRQGRTFKTSDLEVFNDFYRAPWQEINNVLREKQAIHDRNMESLIIARDEVFKTVRGYNWLEDGHKNAIFSYVNDKCINSLTGEDFAISSSIIFVDRFNSCAWGTIRQYLNKIIEEKEREKQSHIKTQQEEYTQRNKTIKEEEGKQKRIREEYNKFIAGTFYTGDIEVYPYTYLYEKPNIQSKVISQIPNVKVKVLERVADGAFYKVKSDEQVGYILTGFIKQ